ncbi:MAG: SDR family oxidoreductase [Chloroflexi bacterium]|nr:SDR family oxidoreductase [Chloroflexota bacterium]MCI0794771.1 SDR family oxidoreductase [Chloroflexota bacterium]MCI0877561.1 SDR family oxidoreductase [Chloroflexota bacterium]MCI0894230.1 SDR family oxidoreductase [Chloroflexota bacterium]
MSEAKTALVTGGAGFIGSHLVDRLVSQGFRVVVIDNLSTGKLKNLNPAATFHHVDITNKSVVEVFQREQPDLVFHLAAQASVSASTKDPIQDSDINVMGTLRLLEAARRCGIEKFIYSSTGGALYGEPQYTPCDENHPIVPLSPYALSKYVGELYLQLYHRLYLLNYTTLRYGNVYGPRQEPHGEAGVVAIFTQAMLEGKQPQIFGDGNQERDFVYIDDVVEANLAAIERGDADAFNIGTGEKTSVNRIFESIQSIIKYRWGPEHGPARPGEVYQISLDGSKAARELGWTPQATLEEGLGQTVEYFRENVKAAR